VRIASAALIAAAVLASNIGTARADDPSVAAATVLFDEGVKLMDAQRYSEACPQLERSQSLAPSGGTLLVLGECYEKVGRTASAWLALREAAARAASAGKRDVEASTLERARQLEPKLPRLLVTVPAGTRAPGLEIKRDGVVVKDAELGVAVPADPGVHEIVASAPHLKTATHKITTRAGETVDFAVPALAPETSEARVVEGPGPVEPSPAPSTGSSQRIVGLIVAGVGVASLAVGGVFGLMAKSKNDEALEPKNCPEPTRCNPTGLTLTDDATSRALVSTILVAVGATGLAVGGIVFFTAPKADAAPRLGVGTKARLQISPSWGAGSVGGSASLTW
jgi:hypothetical protein